MSPQPVSRGLLRPVLHTLVLLSTEQRWLRAVVLVTPTLAVLCGAAAGAAGGVAADPRAVTERFDRELDALLAAAGIAAPAAVAEGSVPPGRTGRDGVHTRWLPPLLEEMQAIARAHPMGRW